MQAQWSFKTQYQRWSRPNGLSQYSANGDASLVVFLNAMPKGMPAQWSFTMQCQWGYKPNGLSQCMLSYSNSYTFTLVFMLPTHTSVIDHKHFNNRNHINHILFSSYFKTHQNIHHFVLITLNHLNIIKTYFNPYFRTRHLKHIKLHQNILQIILSYSYLKSLKHHHHISKY